MRIPFLAFLAEACALAKGFMGLLAFQETDGDPCTTICQYYDCGACPHYQRLKEVPADFDSEIPRTISTHPGLCCLMMRISASSVIPLRLLPFGIHLVTASDALQIRTAKEMWEEILRSYPNKKKRIDAEKLAADIERKLRSRGLI